MDNKQKTKKSRGLVAAGVFIALYFVVFMVIGMICMPVPVMYLMMSSIIAIFAAPVYMMLVAKAPMHGPLFIAAVLPCLFLLAAGNIWIVIVTGILAGLICEVIAGMGKFKNAKLNTIAYIFFTQNLLGGFLPVWIMRSYYFEDTLERGMSADFVNTLEAMTPGWVLLLMIAATVLCSLIGAAISKRLFKKHFEKAGIV